jgi:acetoin utilization deacetylase AcuC-like enzyme
MEAVRAAEKKGLVSVIAPRPAAADDVLLVHTGGYLKTVTAEIAAGRRVLSTGDTEISTGSLPAALAAAGAVMAGVDAVVGGRAASAFCAVRPPGF